jgi:hypothetical protein
MMNELVSQDSAETRKSRVFIITVRRLTGMAKKYYSMIISVILSISTRAVATVQIITLA